MLHRFRVWLNSRWYKVTHVVERKGERAGTFVGASGRAHRELRHVNPRTVVQAKALDPDRYRRVTDRFRGKLPPFPTDDETATITERRLKNVRARREPPA